MNAVHMDPPPNSQSAQHEVSVPYPPSFIDRFMDFIRRLPLPYGITYFILFILESAVILILTWKDGWLPANTIHPIVFSFPLWLWGPLAIITYLDALSHRVLSEFEPLLDISPESRQRLDYEFTTMPGRNVFLNCLAWEGFFFLSWYLVFRPSLISLGGGTLSTRTYFLAGVFSFFIGSVFYYHTIRQLRLVSRTVARVQQFDLFKLNPVYAFSTLTSRTGVGWVILLTLNLFTVPLEIGSTPELILLISQVIFALGTFLLPLRIVNKRLVTAKHDLLAELDQRFKVTLTRLHQHIDENSIQEVLLLNNVLKGLNTERKIIERIPTWPWRPGLFTGFISIIVLPVILFLIQITLGKWLGS